jgi:hypothetical protein
MTASFSSTAYVPTQLIASNADQLTGEKITLISGQNLVRGTVLGKITTGGKFNKSLAAAGDGSQTPDMILAEDCDATAGDKFALAYARGDFIQESLILGTGHTVASIKEGLRVKGIFLIPSLGA